MCGACTVLIDGEPTRSCLVFAVQCEGAEIGTVEGLAGDDGTLHPLQEAFREAHALQCGFCTPGFLMSLLPLYDQRRSAAIGGGGGGDGVEGEPPMEAMNEEEIREALSGNLCRCTGYQNIVEAVRIAMGPAPDGSGGQPTVEGR